MKRLVSRKTTEKHTKKYKDSTRSHVGLILKDYKEHKIKMEEKAKAKHENAKIEWNKIVIIQEELLLKQ